MKHWCNTSLEDVFEILDADRIPINADERSRREGSVPYYGATGQVGWIDGHLFDEELVLLGEDGAPFLEPGRPKAYLIRGKAWVNNHAHVLRHPPGTPASFWKYQLDQIDYRDFVSGTTRLKLSQGPMRRIPLQVPPAAEQCRIAAALDDYYSLLDSALDCLKHVRANLKRYRASVLKSAVEGRLVPTEAELARAERRDYEPASRLLERILVERRRRWEESELARLKAAGKLPKDDRWKARYEEPTPPDTADLPTLPDGWTWTSISALIVEGPQNGLYVPKARYGGGTPILRIDDYQWDWSRSTGDLQAVEIDGATRRTYALNPSELVINRVNSPSHLGKALVVPPNLAGVVVESNMMRMRLAPQIEPHFVTSCLESVDGRRRLTADAKWAVNQASINQEDVRKTAIPLPPAVEQRRICEALSMQLASAQRTAQVALNCARRVDRLRQSVLRWAFEGKLVDEEPSDEPAEVLLARIQAQRETEALAPAVTVVRKRRGKKSVKRQRRA